MKGTELFALKEKWVSEGRCRNCGSPHKSKNRHCHKCITKVDEWKQHNGIANMMDGYCRCGKEYPAPNRRNGVICMERNRIKTRRYRAKVALVKEKA